MRRTYRPVKRNFIGGVARIQRDSYFNNAIGTNWYEYQAAVRKRSGGLCETRLGLGFCGQKAKDVHHIVSLRRGGTTTMSNLIHLCEDCHKSRHTHLR